MAYYSGQGVLYVAERNTDGTPKGFVSLGNVPSLEVSVEVTKFEHKESMSGSRAVDLTIVQEKKGTFRMTLEDMAVTNLAMAFWGETAAVSSGAVTDLLLEAQVAATDTDYRIPIINYSTGVAYAGISAVTVGSTSGSPVITYEFGTSESAAGSKNGWIDLNNGSLIIFSTAKQTAKGAAANIANGVDLYLDFTAGAGTLVHAFTKTSMERWLRFEGLNTINNKPVVIDMFKASLDPLSGYGVINEELASFEVSGSLLYDALQAGTSKFFRQMNVT
jgi:hypothetical protein